MDSDVDVGGGVAWNCANRRHGNVVVESTNTGIGRRAFLVQSGLLAAAAALAGCGTTSDISSPTLSSNTTVDVNSYSTLSAVGGVALVTAGGAQLAIVRTGSSSFVALSRVCPHQGGIREPDWKRIPVSHSRCHLFE